MSGVTRLPPRGPGVPGCLDLSLDLDVGELVRGHRVIVRGICLHGGGLVLQYELAPGITARMQRRGVPALFFGVAYGSDVPAEDEDQGSEVGALAPGEGGATTHGSRSFPLPPDNARLAWFEFFAAAGDSYERPVSKMTVDLTTGQAQLES
jgi:hypothetical protein